MNHLRGHQAVMAIEAILVLLLTLVTVSVMGELAHQEKIARQYIRMAASGPSKAQIAKAHMLCSQRKRRSQAEQAPLDHERRFFGLSCHTDVYWIKDQTVWEPVCEGLSEPKFRPHRYFMVKTLCFFAANHQKFEVNTKELHIIHWLEKS